METENGLVLSEDLARSMPTLFEGLRKAQGLFGQIHSFEDVERLFLKGAGLSPNTYRSYLQAVKQFYAFTKGLNPLQVRPGDIESFYDDLVARVDRNTAYLRIRGLKKFFEGVRQVVPIYTSPFEVMSEKLSAKLNRTRKGRQTKKALDAADLRALLTFLRGDISIRGREDHALVFMLATSGLRASELCSLHWGDLDSSDGHVVARFVGKGEKSAEQELYAPALEATRAYFAAQFHRAPRPEDRLFYTVPLLPTQEVTPMNAHTLWARVHKLGEAARAAGAVTRDVQWSPHLFRRTYASVLYRQGMKLKGIQNLTRHANIETLCKHYVDDSEPATPYLAAALA